MRFRKIALALFACLALGAFAANSASAAEGDGWTIEGSGVIPSGTHQGVSCTKHVGSLVLTSTLLGLGVELSAENVDCFKEAGSSSPATIDNTTSKGHSEGILIFTGVKVLKPSTKCTVGNAGNAASQEVTTEKLTGQVIMGERIDELSGGVKVGTAAVVDKFTPESGATGAFVTIEFGGAECPLSGSSAPVKGSACGESPNNTGFLAPLQTLIFGATQQTAGGCALTLGTKPAVLSGSIDNMLAGTNINKWFGAD